MIRESLSRELNSGRLGILSGYTQRLLSPPLPGDGLLFIGFIEGVVGWSLSWLLVSSPSLVYSSPLARFGLIESIVWLWIGLTVGIVGVGVRYTAPVVRRNRIWLVWAGLNTSAVAVNLIAVGGWFPGPREDVPLVREILGAGYWQPWFLALGVGYLATGLYDWSNPQLRKSERIVYALAGVTALLCLTPWLPVTPLSGTELFLAGGLLHVVPMGFDVAADLVLILRRTS